MADDKNISEEYVVKFSADIGDLDKNLDAANDKVDETVSQLDRASKAWNDYRARITDTFARAKESMKPFTDGIKNDLKNMTSGMGKNRLVSPDTSGYERISDAMSEATQKTNVFKSLWDKMTTHEGTFSDEAEKIREKIAGIKDEMTKLSQTKVQTDDYKWVTSEIDKANEKLADYLAKQDKMNAVGVKHNSSAWKYLQYDIDQTRFRLNDLIATKHSFEADGDAYTSGVDTSQYADYSAQLAGLEAKLAEVESTGATVASSIGQKLKAGISTGAKTGISIVKTGLSNMGKAAKGAINHFRNLRKETTSLDDVMKKAHSTFTRFRRMLVSRIKERFITLIFKDMSENVGSIAEMSDRFNDSISGMIASCKNLGMQIVAALEPIISVAGPYVESFVDNLTAGADKIAQFAARLTGNSTYLKSTKGNYDYAKSLDKTTSSTKKATKATKEYQNTVLGFDRLNKLDGTDADTDDLIGIDNAGLQKAETQATALNRIADKIHDAFSRGDYYGAGHSMAEGVNELFTVLKNTAGWEANCDKITGILHNFVDGVNGFTDGFDPAAAGEAIGDVINTLIESFRILTDPESGLPFEDIGRNIGEILVHAVETTNWKDLGIGIIQGIQSGVNLVNGFLSSEIKDKETGEMQSLGASLGNSLSDLFGGAIEALEPSDWADLISGFVNNLADFITKAFEDEEKYGELGTKLADTVNQTVDQIDADKVADAITSLSTAFTTMFVKAVEGVDWSLVWDKLGEVLGSEKMNIAAVLGSVGIIAAPSLTGTIVKNIPKLVGAAGKIGAKGIPKLAGLAAAHPMAALGVAGVSAAGLGLYEIARHGPLPDYANRVVKGEATEEDKKSIFKPLFDGIDNLFGAKEMAESLKASVESKTNDLGDVATSIDTANDAQDEHVKTIKDGLSTAATKNNAFLGSVTGALSDYASQVTQATEDVKNIKLGTGAAASRSGITIPKRWHIPGFANGGIIGDGQLFVANEGGRAELIGDDGQGNTAVVNNGQIINAVVSGVRQGMMDVMMTMSDNRGNDSTGDIVLMVDSEELARATVRGQRRIDKRVHPTVSFA